MKKVYKTLKFNEKNSILVDDIEDIHDNEEFENPKNRKLFLVKQVEIDENIEDLNLEDFKYVFPIVDQEKKNEENKKKNYKCI